MFAIIISMISRRLQRSSRLPKTNQPPTISFIVNVVSRTATADASASSDPDGTISAYSWDWGDGHMGNGANMSHTYSSDGIYIVKLTVTDNNGAVTTATQNITIDSMSTYSIWPSNPTPTVLSDADATGIELGVKFRASSSLAVTGIRFYKSSQNTGIHTGSLWTSSGLQLASVVFTDETASGWQKMLFASPVTIAANMTYIASYFAPNGHYSSTANYFSSAVTTGPLTALSDGTSRNGVYSYGISSVFPTSDFNATNYWVDIIAQDTAPDTQAPSPPTGLVATAISSSRISLSWTSSTDNVGVDHYAVFRGGTQVGISIGASYQDDGLSASTSYTYTVKAYDTAGNASNASNTVSATTQVANTIHGRDIFASNTGIAGNGVSESSLQTIAGMTYVIDGQIVEGKLFTDSVVVNADNVTIRNCKFKTSGSNTQSLHIKGANVRVEYCTFTTSTGSVYMQVHISGSGATVYRCDISRGENNITVEADTAHIEESYLHDSSNVSNTSGHRDTIEIYGGNDVAILRSKLIHPTGETATINIAPWWQATNVIGTTIDDCYLDGGHAHILVDLQSTGVIQNTRVRRNNCGGHTPINIFGSYAAFQNQDGRAIVQTETELGSNPNAVLWPISGADANYWSDCGDLIPDKTGQVVVP